MKSNSKIVLLVSSLFIVGFASGAAAHGNLSMEEDYCKLRVGPYYIHFSGYQPAKSGPEEFCEDIPNIGQTFVVLDYVHNELRDLLTEIIIIEDIPSLDDEQQKVVFKIPPTKYPKGSLNFEMNFPEEGNFIGLVKVRGIAESYPGISIPEGQEDIITARFPFAVGGGNSWLIYVILIPLVLLAGAVLYHYAIGARDGKSKI